MGYEKGLSAKDRKRIPIEILKKKSAHSLQSNRVYTYSAHTSDPANSHGAQTDLPRCTDIFVFWSAGSAVYHPRRKCGPRRFLVCH